MKLSPKTRSRSVALILLMAVITIGSAFAIVWTQQQISRTAQSTKEIEADLAEMVRKISFLDERIATLHQPVVLQGKVAGTLRPSMENQVVWVREREMPNGRAYAVSAPYEASIDLAMLNANSPR
ncbi:hypothetical protein DDZ13_04615 [Coraliomargarita sinensis]|uniref:Uncharacterized protein n=1 Tax=Coraliomargarita sinensis TaxID=2174842 RepID=A0A317ZI41_9BACT|nr:hypothetical protein [Coraliomargarita sinensis]PXA05246.1 hypothetical protein DDZ13_04615 [Coraliomargarita sinensis]